MKTELTSADVYVLAKELNEILNYARIDKVYQTAERELRIRFYSQRTELKNLVIAPNYMCATKFSTEIPEQPTSFAMQLRKNLSGLFIKEVSQHEFDRIVEIGFGRDDITNILVVELFSKGNVILCDKNKRILGLLERQMWKDRTLKVGLKYEYPPKTADPLQIDSKRLKEIFKNSDKNLVKILAVDVGLGGFYAEEVCLSTEHSIDKNPAELSESEIKTLHESIRGIFQKIENNQIRPQIIFDKDKNMINILPLDSKTYQDFDKKYLTSFNESVDEYFSRQDFTKTIAISKKSAEAKREKLELIKKQQEETITKLEKDSERYQKIGDQIYQNNPVIEKIVSSIESARKKSLSDNEIVEKFREGAENGILEAKYVKSLKKNELVLDM